MKKLNSLLIATIVLSTLQSVARTSDNSRVATPDIRVQTIIGSTAENLCELMQATNESETALGVESSNKHVILNGLNNIVNINDKSVKVKILYTMDNVMNCGITAKGEKVITLNYENGDLL